MLQRIQCGISFKRGDRNRSDSGNSGIQRGRKCSVLLTKYMLFRPKTAAHPNHSLQRRGGAGQSCLGCTLLFWVFIFVCQTRHHLHHDISPLGTECDFFYSAVSEPHLNAPSKLPEANELPVTTANIFKHRASSRREPLAHCEASTCTHIRRGKANLLGKQSLRGEGEG